MRRIAGLRVATSVRTPPRTVGIQFTVAFSGCATSSSSSALCVQARNISWGTVLNPTKWFGSGEAAASNGFQDKMVGNVRVTSAKIEEELPEIFAHQPQEVEDYIRPEQSWFEKLEDVWEYLAGFFRPVDKQVEVMRSLMHDGLWGLDFGGWGAVFVFYGFVLRAITLIPALYSHRNALRMSHLGPQITELTNSQNRVKNDRTLSTAEKRVAKEGILRMKSAICKKNGCAQWKSFTQGITAPITLSAFMAVRRLSVYETDLEKASFLWVTDLTLPDPMNILPVICASMFVINFELNQKMQRGGRSSTGMYLRWAVRLGAGVFVYFFASQPSAMFAYWIGLSTAGLLQPMLLRNQSFRKFFNFPDPPQVAKEAILRSELKGPTLMERLFSAKEDLDRKEKERDEKLKALREKRFEKIDDFDVVFDKDVPPKK